MINLLLLIIKSIVRDIVNEIILINGKKYCVDVIKFIFVICENIIKGVLRRVYVYSVLNLIVDRVIVVKVE